MASSSQKGKDFMRLTKSVGVDFDDKPLWNHVKFGETRFASHIIVTIRIRKVKSSLEKMVMDDKWKNYKGDKRIEAKTREIKSLIMNDEKWDGIDYFTILKPIVDMLSPILMLAPNEDSEISLNRVNCFQRYFKDSNEMKQVSLEYGSSFSGSGYFSEPHVIEAMMYEDSLSWWVNPRVRQLLLQQLAYKLLTR
ncbi:hypothetical protein H5410_002488 [Solanum commersonii]|uniref:Uncharacterized protein n=1 Tax=Solanum commersonii TaxID=4109 RepID=A0A9J6B2F0_SOLCO|nr:hypothetical protein H5410_002488 [Solanum commersonii]